MSLIIMSLNGTGSRLTSQSLAITCSIHMEKISYLRQYNFFSLDHRADLLTDQSLEMQNLF